MVQFETCGLLHHATKNVIGFGICLAYNISKVLYYYCIPNTDCRETIAVIWFDYLSSIILVYIWGRLCSSPSYEYNVRCNSLAIHIICKSRFVRQTGFEYYYTYTIASHATCTAYIICIVLS